MRRDPASFRAALLTTTSHVALWGDLAAVDNLSAPTNFVRFHRGQGLQRASDEGGRAS